LDAMGLGETGPLSQGVQAGRKALRMHHVHGMDVRQKRPRGFKKRPGGSSEPPDPLSYQPRAMGGAAGGAAGGRTEVTRGSPAKFCPGRKPHGVFWRLSALRAPIQQRRRKPIYIGKR
jgi:hypothetical protein